MRISPSCTEEEAHQGRNCSHEQRSPCTDPCTEALVITAGELLYTGSQIL